jgi:hypothetical protein
MVGDVFAMLTLACGNMTICATNPTSSRSRSSCNRPPQVYKPVCLFGVPRSLHDTQPEKGHLLTLTLIYPPALRWLVMARSPGLRRPFYIIASPDPRINAGFHVSCYPPGSFLPSDSSMAQPSSAKVFTLPHVFRTSPRGIARSPSCVEW